MTKDEDTEARAPRWAKDAAELVRGSFQISFNGLDCETRARVEEFRDGDFSVVATMEARTKPTATRRGTQIHRAEMRLTEYDLVRFGLHPFIKERLEKLLVQLAVTAFKCGTIFEDERVYPAPAPARGR